MKCLASGVTLIPRGVTRAYVVQPQDIGTIPATGLPIVIVDHEEGGANVLYSPFDTGTNDVWMAWYELECDRIEVKTANQTSRIGFWSVPGTEDTNDQTRRELSNEFAWPVMARADFACLNCYIGYDAPADYWVKGCVRIARVFKKPIICGTTPLFMYGDNQLKEISDKRLHQHYTDIRDAGSDYILHWGEYRQVMEVGRWNSPRNENDKTIREAFERNHADKLDWTAEMLAEWCDALDKRSLKIMKECK